MRASETPLPEARPRDEFTLQPLISAARVHLRVQELGKQLRGDYGDEPLTLLCVLKGSLVFAADLCRAIPGEVRLEYLAARSYGDARESSGSVTIAHQSIDSLAGAHVLLVEDIVDTGLTAKTLLDLLGDRGAKSLRLAALLFKPAMGSPVVPDYVGFEIGEEFVVGYGLDWAGRYRNLPDIVQVLPVDSNPPSKPSPHRPSSPPRSRSPRS